MSSQPQRGFQPKFNIAVLEAQAKRKQRMWRSTTLKAKPRPRLVRNRTLSQSIKSFEESTIRRPFNVFHIGLVFSFIGLVLFLPPFIPSFFVEGLQGTGLLCLSLGVFCFFSYALCALVYVLEKIFHRFFPPYPKHHNSFVDLERANLKDSFDSEQTKSFDSSSQSNRSEETENSSPSRGR